MPLLCGGSLSEIHGHNLLLALRVNHKEKNFIIWEMILLHFFAVIKEMEVGRDTSISYITYFPK